MTPKYYFALREDLKDKPEFLPTRSEPLATGWDVRCAEPNGVIIKPSETVLISLGFRAFCPGGWWMEIKPRSSSFTKKNLHCLYGTIDESWEGEWKFACQYLPSVGAESLKIEFGERISQIIPVRRVEMNVESVSNTELDKFFAGRDASRKTGGFGSSGDR